MPTTIGFGWERVATRRYPDTQLTTASAHDVTHVLAVTDSTGVSLTVTTVTGEILCLNLFGCTADDVARAIAHPSTMVAA